MIYIIMWVILCALVGAFASSKHRTFIGYMLLSVVLSPLIGFIIVAVAGDAKEQSQSETGPKKKCSACAEFIKAEASICRYCGKEQPSDSSVVHDHSPEKPSSIQSKSGLDL